MGIKSVNTNKYAYFQTCWNGISRVFSLLCGQLCRKKLSSKHYLRKQLEGQAYFFFYIPFSPTDLTSSFIS